MQNVHVLLQPTEIDTQPVLEIHADEVGHIPVHQQVVVWAARQNISLQLMADNYFPLRYVRVQ